MMPAVCLVFSVEIGTLKKIFFGLWTQIQLISMCLLNLGIKCQTCSGSHLVWGSCCNLIIPSVSLFQIGYIGKNEKLAELYLVWHVSQWGQKILSTESSMGIIRNLPFRFRVYVSVRAFRKVINFLLFLE